MTLTGAFPPSRCKRHLEIVLGKMLQPESSTDLDVVLPYIRAANVGGGRIDTTELKEMWFTPRDARKFNLKKGDLIVLEGGDVGRSAILDETPDGVGFQNSVHRVRPLTGNDARFSHYWITHLKESGYIELICSKATLSHFTVEKFSESPYPSIDTEIQCQIANFLDRETARIDQLIEKKQRLVELLDERRAALITAAVSGEICSTDDSRITHGEQRTIRFWPSSCSENLRPLKRICTINPESLSELTDPDYEFEYIDIGNVTLQNGIQGRERMRFEQSPSRARKPVKAGDVIVSTVRTYLKAVARIGTGAKDLVVSTGFAVLRPRLETDSRFLHRVTQSNPFIEGIVADSVGVSYPAINPSVLGSSLVPFPDTNTQQGIADFLDRETLGIDSVKSKTLTSIDRLRDFRSSLITHAVTGQIDVSEWRKQDQTEHRIEQIQESSEI